MHHFQPSVKNTLTIFIPTHQVRIRILLTAAQVPCSPFPNLPVARGEKFRAFFPNIPDFVLK
jgi:hypothetical protein